MGGGGDGVYAYRDLDEELFAPLGDDCGYEMHQSPVKKLALCTSRSESSLLHAHLAHRRAVRSKVLVALSFLVLVAVGSVALYCTMGASARALAPSTTVFRGHHSPLKPVFQGEDSLVLEAAARGMDRGDWDEDAEDVDDVDPYAALADTGRVLEAE